MSSMTETLTGTEETKAFAGRMLASLIPSKDHATIVGLSGNLGSGKTTFVQCAAKELGILEPVVSPTFILAKYYDLKDAPWKKMIHIDGYRIDVPNEIEVLKWNDMIMHKDYIVFFEWPERIGALFPDFATMLSFEFIDEKTRNVTRV